MLARNIKKTGIIMVVKKKKPTTTKKILSSSRAKQQVPESDFYDFNRLSTHTRTSLNDNIYSEEDLVHSSSSFIWPPPPPPSYPSSDNVEALVRKPSQVSPIPLKDGPHTLGWLR